MKKTSITQKINDLSKNCVHCGFCLATCPTYQLLGNELDSPRGRIYLIQSSLKNNDFSATTTLHLDRCLTCRACETTCPSEVKYHQLLEVGRQLAERKRPYWQKIYRHLVRKTLTNPHLFKAISIFLTTEKITQPLISPPINAKKILLLGGCIQPNLAPNINHNLKNILAKLGYQAIETPQTQCCGAIDQHLNAKDDALRKVKNNIDTWLKSDFTNIISSASGCGLMIKDYPELFNKGDKYYEKAQLISQKTIDIAEFLAEQDLSQFRTEPVQISHHAPCTLQHGQKLTGLVESILTQLGYRLTPVTDAHLCCGSAGTYSIFQPKLANTLQKNKLKNLCTEKTQLITTANIGCLMHLQKSSKIPVKHWTQLLIPE
jgi:glycolate oxidase iron-sulfur subunit